jgi:hypothetical protein
MRSIAVGSVVAAIVMFALGFVFYGLLGMMMYAPLGADVASSVQDALGGNLSATGTYMVPADEEGWMRGPSAVVSFVAAGDAPSMAAAMTLGFVHFLVSALLIGLALKAVRGDFARRARTVLWFGLAASAFMHLGDPIWYGFSWRPEVSAFLADAVMFIAGGLVLARWFTSSREAAPAGAAAVPAA